MIKLFSLVIQKSSGAGTERSQEGGEAFLTSDESLGHVESEVPARYQSGFTQQAGESMGSCCIRQIFN